MLVRLQKYLAECGIASRRKAEELIATNKVKVNGKIVSEMGAKIDPELDTVWFEGKQVLGLTKHYIMLHKPNDYLTTRDDPGGRRTVFDLLPEQYKQLHPIGRLDRNSTGLLLFTNDGDFTQILMHPRKKIGKKYRVTVNKRLLPEDMNILISGIQLDGKLTLPAKINVLDNSFTLVDMQIFEGRNRQIRRMFESLGYDVVKLKRLSIGNITLGKLAVGKYRLLTPTEIGGVKIWANKK